MPKRVDHDERRREIGAAVARIAAADGLEAVSMRRVAAEAGISTPLVQHYFTDKDAMLRFAITDLTDTARGHAEQRARERIGPEQDPATVLRTILDELLPLDDERRTVMRVHLAFFARAVRDPDLASFYRDAFPAEIGPLAGMLREEQRAGRAPAGIDPEHEVKSLISLGLGLATDMLLGFRTAGEASDLIDYHLRRLLPGPPETGTAKPAAGADPAGQTPGREDA